MSDSLLVDADPDAPGPAPAQRFDHPAWLLLGLMLVALNLRPALSSLSPLLVEVRADLGISQTVAGLLTTAPVLCLGLFGAVAPGLARRLGTEGAVLAAMVLIAVGLLVRSGPVLATMVAGSVMAGAGIGIAGVLLPGMIKREFPDKPGLMTGLYSSALCLGAAMAAGATVPIGELFASGWRLPLAAWALPAVLAIVAWLPQLRRRAAGARKGAAPRIGGLWRDPLAWQVTAYMGLQSSLAYSVFGWLPAILRDRGMSPVAAGLLLSSSVLIQAVSSLIAPALAARARDQRPIAVGMVVAVGISLFGCLLAPLESAWLWSILLGLGQGGCFGVALTLVLLRSRDARVAAELSGMSQSVGYTLAALGPLGVGLVHEVTGGWTAVAILFSAIAVAAIVAGLGAGRPRLVADRVLPDITARKLA